VDGAFAYMHAVSLDPMHLQRPQTIHRVVSMDDFVDGDLYFIALASSIGKDIITMDRTIVMSADLQVTVEPAKIALYQQQPFITVPQASVVGEVLTLGNQSALQILESILMATLWPLPTM